MYLTVSDFFHFESISFVSRCKWYTLLNIIWLNIIRQILGLAKFMLSQIKVKPK